MVFRVAETHLDCASACAEVLFNHCPPMKRLHISTPPTLQRTLATWHRELKGPKKRNLSLMIFRYLRQSPHNCPSFFFFIVLCEFADHSVYSQMQLSTQKQTLPHFYTWGIQINLRCHQQLCLISTTLKIYIGVCFPINVIKRQPMFPCMIMACWLLCVWTN